MNSLSARMSSLILRVGKPMLTNSFVMGCTLLLGDALAQLVSFQYDSMLDNGLFVICSDWKRSSRMGVTGFFISGPLSYLLNQTLNRLYPGKGRLTGEFCIALLLWKLVLKRVAMTTSISPLVIGCGVLASTWLFSGDIDKARVGDYSLLVIFSTM